MKNERGLRAEEERKKGKKQGNGKRSFKRRLDSKGTTQVL